MDEVELCIEQLKHKSVSIRWSAIETLGRSRDGRAVVPLSHVLEQGDRYERERAARSLSQIGSLHVIEPLRHALGNEDSLVSWQAQQGLLKIGTPALEKLCLTLKEDSLRTCLVAAQLICEISNERTLYQALDAAIQDGQGNASWSQEQTTLEQTVEILCLALKNTHVGIRIFAATALTKFYSSQAIKPLCQALTDQEELVRGRATVALGNTGQREVLPALKSRLRFIGGEPNHGVRKAIHTAIEQIEAATSITIGLPRTAAAEMPDSQGRPRVTEKTLAPEGRPRAEISDTE